MQMHNEVLHRSYAYCTIWNTYYCAVYEILPIFSIKEIVVGTSSEWSISHEKHMMWCLERITYMEWNIS